MLIPWIALQINQKQNGINPLIVKNFHTRWHLKMFLKREYKDSIYRFIRESELRETQEYKYSDLPYYLLMKYLEGYYGLPLEELVQQNFYESIGAYSMGYNPLDRFDKKSIVPYRRGHLF